MTPRAHNVLSYLVALFAMPAAGCWSIVQQNEPLPASAYVLGLLWSAHFARRSAEALWVHRYGKPSFPWSDALLEYAYYWGFGVWIGATSHATPALDTLSVVGIVLFVGAELGNNKAHRLLRDLRPAHRPDERAIPRGWAFEWISCPHYAFEILSWVGFAFVARSWAAATFAGLGAAILATWATQRHRAYQADFDGSPGRDLYPKRRRALVPFVY